MKSKKVFLKAEWRKLIMINYEVSPHLLTKYIPNGTEIDFWQGKTFVSIVGFMFLNTKVLNIPIPFHRNFEEVNLRFYVKRKLTDETRRGVVFIREIVPKTAIATIANWLYNENYISLYMNHQISEVDSLKRVKYSWKQKKQHYFISVESFDTPQPLQPNSQEEFIAEHYWGYSKNKDRTIEYKVEHPTWVIYPVNKFQLEGNFEKLYGKEFNDVFNQPPTSVFLAEGSEILVRKPSII